MQHRKHTRRLLIGAFATAAALGATGLPADAGLLPELRARVAEALARASSWIAATWQWTATT